MQQGQVLGGFASVVWGCLGDSLFHMYWVCLCSCFWDSGGLEAG